MVHEGALQTDVLVVGGGPVGLMLAVELGHRGIDVVLVEKTERGGHQPRAKTTNIRSMQLLRRWGLAGKIRAAGPLPADYPTDIVFATRLFGKKLAKFENVFFGYRQRERHFPEPAQWIPQYTVEACLRDDLDGLPNVALRFGTTLKGFRQDEGSVLADIETPDGEVTIRARYLVGADGGRSDTRRLLGIRMLGEHAYMGNFLAIYRAPGLSASHPQDPAISYWLVNADCPAVTGPMDRGDTWFFSTQLPQGVEGYGLDEARTKIRQALGADFPFEIVETDTWFAHKLVAERYRDGRVFLAGDACHLHPPMGGYGMNMGLGDAVDLGWKLAARIEGWGGDELLTSYERERRPIHQSVIEEAAHNYSFVTYHMVKNHLESDSAEGETVRNEVGARILEAKAREFRAIGVVLGYRYEGSPIIVSDETAPPQSDPMSLVPSAYPGRIAPHFWLTDGTSLFDRLGPGFTLLVLDTHANDAAATLVDNAERLGIPLKRLDLFDSEIRRVYEAPLAIIRPDQHVAWRGSLAGEDATDLLNTISGNGAARVSRAAE